MESSTGVEKIALAIRANYLTTEIASQKDEIDTRVLTNIRSGYAHQLASSPA